MSIKLRSLLQVMLLGLLLATLLPAATFAAAPAAERHTVSPETAVVQLLQQQAADWNRGDLVAFANGYKHSPEILFIGRTVRHGFDGMLAGYRQSYPTPAAMGRLTFSQLAVQPLDRRFATATGHFHLERAAADGGNDDGHFLLVLERTADGWRIVRDDTTAEPAP